MTTLISGLRLCQILFSGVWFLSTSLVSTSCVVSRLRGWSPRFGNIISILSGLLRVLIFNNENIKRGFYIRLFECSICLRRRPIRHTIIRPTGFPPLIREFLNSLQLTSVLRSHRLKISPPCHPFFYKSPSCFLLLRKWSIR